LLSDLNGQQERVRCHASRIAHDRALQSRRSQLPADGLQEPFGCRVECFGKHQKFLNGEAALTGFYALDRHEMPPETFGKRPLRQAGGFAGFEQHGAHRAFLSLKLSRDSAGHNGRVSEPARLDDKMLSNEDRSEVFSWRPAGGSTRHQPVTPIRTRPMQITAALSDSGSAYRAIVRVTYDDLRACLGRLKNLLAEVGRGDLSAVGDLAARRMKHVRDFVNDLGTPGPATMREHSKLVEVRPPRPPILSPPVFAAVCSTLDSIDQQAKTDPATAFECAIRLLDVIAREVSWLARA
jgi:hypothetical protein